MGVNGKLRATGGEWFFKEVKEIKEIKEKH